MNLTAKLPDLRLTADMPSIQYVVAYAIIERVVFLDTDSLQVNDTDGNPINLMSLVGMTGDYALTLVAKMPDLRLSGDI